MSLRNISLETDVDRLNLKPRRTFTTVMSPQKPAARSRAWKGVYVSEWTSTGNLDGCGCRIGKIETTT